MARLRWVGGGLSGQIYREAQGRLRAEWNKAVRGAPALLVIEDVDSLGGGGAEGGATELERRVVGCLASLLDSLALHPAPRLAVLAITASLDRVDPALRRPGRSHFILLNKKLTSFLPRSAS